MACKEEIVGGGLAAHLKLVVCFAQVPKVRACLEAERLHLSWILLITDSDGEDSLSIGELGARILEQRSIHQRELILGDSQFREMKKAHAGFEEAEMDLGGLQAL